MHTNTITRSETAFTFVRGTNFSILKNPDGGVKKVPERFIDDLLKISTGEATVSDYPDDFEQTVSQLREDGYIYEGPVVELEQPSFRLAPYVLLCALLFAPYVWITVTNFDLIRAVFGSLSTHPPVWIFLYGPLVMLPTVAVHELGHYRESAKHTPVSFGLGTINGFIPAFKTYTTETWLLRPRHRMWINIAGVTYQSAAALPLVGMYYFDVYPPLPQFEAVLPWLLMGYVVGTFTFVLNPIYHGDGYLVMTDVLGEYNIRKKAKQAYRDRTVNLYALYGLLSYGLVNVYFLINSVLTVVVWGFLIGGILIGINLLFIVIEFSDSKAREFVSHEPAWVKKLQRDIG